MPDIRRETGVANSLHHFLLVDIHASTDFHGSQRKEGGEVDRGQLLRHDCAEGPHPLLVAIVSQANTSCVQDVLAVPDRSSGSWGDRGCTIGQRRRIHRRTPRGGL